ncbi:GntR family transcriptional regulator [Glycomyces tritici]|uniref:GntR family transcriptional regulator n=1 Tax=Glycomyces tritici TaxID=2665176 RepID=A0ABT7YVM7_9ACTN|nr:GntR family transcriptional regulator [Glycomyces tritici]MDN3242695.1 GntR family transcriptional regulator [Glycomyces tritici]
MPARAGAAPVVAMSLPEMGGRRTSYRERIGEALRAAVITGDLAPGRVYSVPVLAEQFGVSATPVREAMLDLVKEELVEPVPNKGFRVKVVSEAQLDEYTKLRELIEIPTTAALATTADPADIEALRPLAQAIIDAAAEEDLIAYVEADMRFHLEMLALSGNATLVETVRNLRQRSRLYGLTALMELGELEESAGEHMEILHGLLTRDTEYVRQVMELHLSHVRGSWAQPS